MLNVVVRQIKIKDETYEELRNIGKMGESFDSVIRKILDHYKRTAKK
jgi:predicted CopG family antitoxin